MESPFFCAHVTHPIRKVKWVPHHDHVVAYLSANKLNLVRYEPSAATFLDLDASCSFNNILNDVVVFKNGRSMVAAGAQGHLHYIGINQHHASSKTILEKQSSHHLHPGSSCHGLAIQTDANSDPLIASFDRHGRFIVSDSQGKIHFKKDPFSSSSSPASFVDALPISAAVWQSSSTVVACTEAGNVILFDLRKKNANMIYFKDEGIRYPFTCIAIHPSIPSTFATGAISGDVFFWDLRRSSSNSLSYTSNIHQESVNDIAFDVHSPSTVLTCSEDGTISAFDWTNLQKDVYQRNMKLYSNPLHASGWNSIDLSKHVPGLVVAGGDQSDLIVLESSQF